MFQHSWSPCSSLSFYLYLSSQAGVQEVSVQFSHSVTSDSLWPHGLQHARPPVHHQLPEFTQTHVHWVGDAIHSSHPLSSPSTPTFNLSQHQGLFTWISSSHQVPKYWSFSFSISPSNEYAGLISFRIAWLDLLGVQGTLQESKNLLHTWKNTVLWYLGHYRSGI